MTEKTGSSNSWQPMLGAEPARLRLLGELLRLRRAAIGYRHVPAFTGDRGINTRMVGDIEHGRRDTYTFPTLEDAAAAYEVTYASMMAVVWSDAGELVPAPSGPSAGPPPDEGTPPMTPERAAAVRPWFDEINEQRFVLARRGITNPTGAQMFPAAPGDAKAWDDHDHWSVADRVWFIAELHRLTAGRVPNSGTVAGA
jgi:hypothetical protein